ncbi:MAG: polysulfide reductase NrfD [Coriobacteriaceae bacterium]|jgi:molybdopterin-containing oxidoreductase family membrane subunit|nr:polysulfide reductase NrfD [Coriobacteriaceae bacterium]
MTGNTNNNKAAVRSKAQMAAIIIAAVVAVAGIGLWVFQGTAGFVNTNMRNLDSWGLYIICFMWFVGLSAGGLIISSAPQVFGIKGFGGIAKVAVWVSICCTVLAVAFVLVDLGGPARVWHLFVYANMTSPLMWDIIVLAAYLVVSVVYLWATLRVQAGKGSPKALRVLSVIALVCAVMVHTVTAWIFGLLQAHEFWHTALLGPWFVSSALVSGLALVLVIVIALRKAGYLEPKQEDIAKMARLLGVFTAVDLYFLACDLLTLGFPGASGADMVGILATGALAPFFWVEVAAGAFTLLVAFTPSLRTVPLVATAAVLSVLGILCKRVQLLVGGFQAANISYPAVATGPGLTDVGAGTAALSPALVYVPAPLELGIVVGVLALGICLLLVGLRYLPLRPVLCFVKYFFPKRAYPFSTFSVVDFPLSA